METHFAPDVMAGLQRARMKDATKKNRLRVHDGEAAYQVLKIWETGFSMPIGKAPQLRGFVDLFDGSKHLLQCLVIYSEPDGDVMNYEFKRRTVVLDQAPKDYAEDANAPVALIEK
jgi:hypothetical protein